MSAGEAVGVVQGGSAPVRARPAREGPGRRPVGLAVVALAAGVAGGPVVMAAAVGAFILGPRLAARRRRAQVGRGAATEVATVFELAARAARAGLAAPTALTQTAHDRGGVAATLVTGAPAPTSRYRVRRRDARIVAAVVALVGATTGGGARGLEAGAVLLREEVRTRAEIDAGAAHARASATLLLAVPVLFGGVSLLLIPGAHAQVLGHPAALAAVVLGAVLEVVGVLWSARLVRAVRGCDW